MKTSSERSSTTSSRSARQPSYQPFFAKAGRDGFFSSSLSASPIQMKMAVGKPGDKLEQEADKMADKVMRMPSPASTQKEEKLQRQPDEKLQRRKEEEKIQKAPQKEEKLQRGVDEKLQKKEEEKIQKAQEKEEKLQRQPDEKLQKKEEEKLLKAPEKEEKLQRKGGDGTPSVGASLQSSIQSNTAGGQPLSSDVRGFMEPRLGADFSNVRVHNDADSARLNNQLSARAFTYQNHVFFSRDQYQPGSNEGKQLLAHELTHTIQQGHAVQRSPQISTTTTPPAVQRLGIQDALDYFADKAANIPGFTMLTLLLGFNPISTRTVSRTAANLLRALIELVPGGNFITQALDNHGVINKAAAWVEQKIAVLGAIGGEIVGGLKRFIDSLGWSDIFHLGSVWDRAKAIFTAPISRLISFGTSVVVEILKMVKDAILKPLAALAQGTRGYDLLKAILGEDPITGEAVPRTAETLLGGFMKFIGQDEIWENIKKGNAIPRAWAWFQGALSSLMGMVRAVPHKIVATLSSLTFMDIITVVGVFGKVAGVFINIAVDFISWGLSTTWSLLEIIFDVVKPGIMGYIKKTGAALKSIIKNPLPFVGNLVRAAKAGFQNFADNFGGHLKAGLIDWLTGSLSGVYIPKALSLPELGKFAMSVLGITWAQIRGKIVKVLGANGETIMKGLETGFDIVVALVTGGPAAAWELIKEKLTELKDQVVGGIIGFVTDTVIKKAVPKLIAMFIPGAGFISAIISIYDTVMVFVEKISKIIQVVVAFIDSIVTIAAGNITAAAKRVESILGGLLSLAISFLAGFLGLGKVTDKIMGVIEKVRASVDKAIDAVINWIVTKAKALFAKLFGKKDKTEQSKVGGTTVKEGFSMGPAGHTLTATEDGQSIKITMASEEDIVISVQLGSAIDLIQSDKEVDNEGHPVKREPSQKAVILTDLQTAKARVDDLRQDYEKAGKPEAFEKFVKPRLAAIIGSLTRLAKRKPEITSLKPLISFGMPRYIPKSLDNGWIRKNLYDRATKGKWTSLSKSLRTTHVTKISAKLYAIWKLRDDTSIPNSYPTAKKQWDAAQAAKEIPVKKAPSFSTYDHPKHFPTFAYETDHRTPLGVFWNGGEKNAGDKERSDTTLDQGNLDVLTKEENQAKGGVKFNRDVGPNFSSVVANSPEGSMTIDKIRFSDKP